MSKKVVTIIRQTFTKGQADLTFVHNPIELSSHLLKTLGQLVIHI